MRTVLEAAGHAVEGKVEGDVLENGKGEAFRVAAALSSGQVTLRLLQKESECFLQQSED